MNNKYVMYIVARESLNLSPGKLGAQCGHAVGAIYKHYHKLKSYSNLEELAQQEVDNFEAWEKDCERKVVLKASDEQFEMLQKEFSTFVIIDLGFTEVEPNTKTVLGIFPINKNHNFTSLKQLKSYK